ncbi:MAG: DNA replication/repair protein RecF [Chlamydiales bacterium]
MRIEKIILWQFRNYANRAISFHPRTNLIRGENAQGKTNLLEAIYFLSTGRSFRTSHLADLIPFNHAFFQLEAHFIKDGVSQSLKASFDGQTRRLSHNETHFSSFSPLLGLLPIVMIAPQDLTLITGAPADRRRFLDLMLAQSDPLYVHYLMRYLKAMKQRNALLRNKKIETIDAWEYAMAQAACYLYKKRREGIAQLTPLAQSSLHALSFGEDQLTILYQPTLAESETHSVETLTQSWAKSRKRELLFGTSLIGPHRDELLLSVNGKLARNYCSEGQKRSLVTALRLAEWKRLKALSGYSPLLCIDDFGIHLDAKRYHLIQKEMQGLDQVFLTTPLLLEESTPADQTLFIKQGQISNEELSSHLQQG